MEDEKIIDLYWNRDEQAVSLSMARYGNYCRAVANSILRDPSDAEEAVADTWIGAWNGIPPQRPRSLRLFLARITRNAALSIWRRNHAQHRGSGEVDAALEELEMCVSGTDSPEDALLSKELEAAISSFLWKEPERNRNVFLRRYFFLEDSRSIGKRYGMKDTAVRMMLARTRQRLREYLIQEGYLT